MLAGILVGCGGDSGSSSGETGSAGGDESVTLRIHCDYNEEHPVSQQLAAFCERVSENTNGTVTIQVYYAGALATAPRCSTGLSEEGSIDNDEVFDGLMDALAVE